jgi:hypothetical protein
MDEERRWALTLVDVVNATVTEIRPPRGERVFSAIDPIGNGESGIGNRHDR